MGGIDLAATMDAIAENLELVTGLRVSAWPADSVAPPAGLVGYPDEIDYDLTYQRGADRATFPVWIVVGSASTRTARDAISTYVSSGAAKEIKTKLDGRLPVAGVPKVASCCVVNATIEMVTIGGAAYLAARFDLDVVA